MSVDRQVKEPGAPLQSRLFWTYVSCDEAATLALKLLSRTGFLLPDSLWSGRHLFDRLDFRACALQRGNPGMQRLVRLSQDRSLISTYSLGWVKTRLWIVLIPESGADFHADSRRELKILLGRSMVENFNVMVINKPGLGPKGLEKGAFEASFRRDHRVRDNLAALKAVIPRNHEIILVGYSEGAYLAPEIALRDRRVKRIVMIGGGTRGWLREELRNASCEREKAALRRQIQKIYRRPHSTEEWNGFSFATWYSYREDRTLNSLKKLNVPGLVLLGARDRTIDYQTTVNDVRRLARVKPIELRVFGHCGHSFASHWPEAAKEIRRFLNLRR